MRCYRPCPTSRRGSRLSVTLVAFADPPPFLSFSLSPPSSLTVNAFFPIAILFSCHPRQRASLSVGSFLSLYFQRGLSSAPSRCRRCVLLRVARPASLVLSSALPRSCYLTLSVLRLYDMQTLRCGILVYQNINVRFLAALLLHALYTSL